MEEPKQEIIEIKEKKEVKQEPKKEDPSIKRTYYGKFRKIKQNLE